MSDELTKDEMVRADLELAAPYKIHEALQALDAALREMGPLTNGQFRECGGGAAHEAAETLVADARALRDSVSHAYYYNGS